MGMDEAVVLIKILDHHANCTLVCVDFETHDNQVFEHRTSDGRNQLKKKRVTCPSIFRHLV